VVPDSERAVDHVVPDPERAVDHLVVASRWR
jgi:hypothetical protein